MPSSPEAPREGEGEGGDEGESTPRQLIRRVAGSRRARLEPAPGTDPSPDAPRRGDAPSSADSTPGPRGENDDRLRQDVPPHW
ncbi:hypothetical protein ELQ90_12175 [Labedella phragmitis]|uniref:Uncharacterized protein n=1 Tax=Labedella phragmitis TaxID=2498849 RepID=A0A3S4BGE7_9MICO|nr:hypothetical protein [Labedella phragmitis]RWZ49522.1 hypothetical protein ELQ90_12175 [Labedella phragmitis]